MSSNSLILERIIELSNLIHKKNFFYYCEKSFENSRGNCSDEVFDKLVEELKLLESQSVARGSS